MATAWERWELASFDKPDEKVEADKPLDEETVVLPTAQEIEAIYQQAKDEGYQVGYQEGKAQVVDEATRLAQAAQSLDNALTDLEQQVADELLVLAIEIARQVVRGEITARPKVILDVVRESLTHLPQQHASITLHPDDVSLVRSFMGETLAHAGHRFHEDARLAHGDCILDAAHSQLDATVATRWRHVLESLGLSNAWEVAP